MGQCPFASRWAMTRRARGGERTSCNGASALRRRNCRFTSATGQEHNRDSPLCDASVTGGMVCAAEGNGGRIRSVIENDHTARRATTGGRAHHRYLGLAGLVLSLVLIGGMPQAGAQTQDPLPEKYQAAQTFLLAGDIESAERAYHEVVAVALERLGNLASREGRLDEALALVDEAVAIMPMRAQAHVARSAILFRRREFDKAIEAAHAALRLEPRHPQATQLLGKLYFVTGRLDEALPYLQEALARDPSFDLAYALAISYVRLKRLTEAQRLFRQLVTALGESARLYILIGRVYREAALYEHAIEEFKRALALNPRQPRAHFLIGLTQLLQGGGSRFADARTQFEAEIAITPDDYASHFFLGFIHLSERRWQEAEEFLKKAQALQPENPDPPLYLGQLYFQTGRYEHAATALKKAIALTTDVGRNNYQVARAHYLLAQSLGRLGRDQEALAELRRSEELRPVALRQQQMEGPLSQARAVPEHEAPEGLLFVDDSAALSPEVARSIQAMLAEMLGHSCYNLGVIRARREQYAQAVEWFRRAARWKPDAAAVDRSLGLAAFRAQQYAEAALPLERHLATHPEDASARQALGMSYFMQDRFTDVLRVWRSWLDAPPDDPALLYALGVSLVRTDQAAAATQLFSRLRQRYGHIPEVHLILGQAYAEEAQYERAREAFEQALALNPSLPEAHYSLGLVLLRQGELDRAAHHFREELRLTPRHRQAKYHLAYVLQQAQQNDEALALLEQLVGDEPAYPEAHYLLGKMLLQRGDVASAIAHLETAVQLAPDQDYAYYQLSLAYRRAHREKDAERALQTYQRLKEKKRQPR